MQPGVACGLSRAEGEVLCAQYRIRVPMVLELAKNSIISRLLSGEGISEDAANQQALKMFVNDKNYCYLIMIMNAVLRE